MSFLDQIKSKINELRPCDTLVTTQDGLVYTEHIGADGMSIKTLPTTSSTFPGYVIDTKPDLQVACVIPGLYMGSQDVTQDVNLLQQHNITNILSLGIRVPQIDDSITYKFVQIVDLPESDLLDVLDETLPYIEESMVQGCVLVHCNAGVSRSAAIVIGYLIKQGMSYEQAHNHLKKERNAIKPNKGFVQQLKIYERILREEL